MVNVVETNRSFQLKSGKPLAFISHSHADRFFATKLAAELRSNKIDVWIDHKQIRQGESVLQRIQEGLSACHVILVLISKNSIDSPWCRAEYEPFIMREIERNTICVFPIRLDNSELPIILSAKRCVDLQNGIDSEAIKDLSKVIWDGTSETLLSDMVPLSNDDHESSIVWQFGSLFDLVYENLLKEFPVSQLKIEARHDSANLIKLYRAIDLLISKFQSLADEASKILVKYHGKRFYEWRGSSAEKRREKARNEVAIVNRKLFGIARDMRDIVCAVHTTTEKNSLLCNKLSRIGLICTAISEAEHGLLLKFGIPPEVPSDNSVMRGQYRSVFDTPGLPVCDADFGLRARDQHILLKLEAYRSDLRNAISELLDTDSEAFSIQRAKMLNEQ